MALAEGAIVGSALINALSQSYTNKANINANLLRFASETELANTAHQREVADLRAAGLNPILSTGTAGAAIPSQQAAQVEAPSVGELGMQLSNARMTDAQVANATQNLAINEPEAQAAKELSRFYRTDEGKATLRDIERLKGAPSNAYEAAYLLGSRVTETPEQSDNPSSAKPSKPKESPKQKAKDLQYHHYSGKAYDPSYRNPDIFRK